MGEFRNDSKVSIVYRLGWKETAKNGFSKRMLMEQFCLNFSSLLDGSPLYWSKLIGSPGINHQSSRIRWLSVDNNDLTFDIIYSSVETYSDVGSIPGNSIPAFICFAFIFPFLQYSFSGILTF